MKNYKIAFATFALALAAFTTLLVSSCQKESLYPPTDEPELFTKEITVTDKRGNNSAVIRLSSENESSLTAVDYSQVIEIEPIFEVPVVEKVAGEAFQENQEDLADDGAGIALEIVSRQLEEGAIGLKLSFKTGSDNTVQDRTLYLAPKTYTTPDNNIAVFAMVGCHKVKYYYKATSGSSWTWIATYNKCPYLGSGAGAIPSYRMKAEITKISTSTVWVDVYSW